VLRPLGKEAAGFAFEKPQIWLLFSCPLSYKRISMVNKNIPPHIGIDFCRFPDLAFAPTSQPQLPLKASSHLVTGFLWTTPIDGHHAESYSRYTNRYTTGTWSCVREHASAGIVTRAYAPRSQSRRFVSVYTSANFEPPHIFPIKSRLDRSEHASQ